MLTGKQRDLLIFINSYITEHGTSPSFEEMKDALLLKSKSGIHRLVNALVEREFLIRREGKARALEVLRMPDAAASHSDIVDFSDHSENPDIHAEPSAEIPLHGKIAAGTPIEALQGQESISVPMSFLGGSECYALTVEGDSMMKAGIVDGDIVVIEKCNTASDGDIVVALVDGEEATLKRLRREIGHVILQPENDSYQPITLAPERVQVQGKLKSLFRYY